MKTYQSAITGEKYTGNLTVYYNEYTNKTEFFIDEAIVLEITDKLDNEEINEYFQDYFEEY